MSFEQITEAFGSIIEHEVWRRYRARNRANADREDLRQEAMLAAWRYCRDKEKGEADGAILRKKIFGALYAAAAKSLGVAMPRNAYKKWAMRSVVCGV